MPSLLQWLSLIGSIWLQSINGTNSNFPAYSSQLKHLLSLSQLQLNNLAFASDAGKLFGWISGLATLYLPLYLVLFIGSILGLIGYGFQYLFITNQITSLSYPHLFFLSVLAGNSICWINTVCYVVTINNFPLNRQIAVGISTSYLGLSAKIYTDFVDALFPSSHEDKARAYLLFNSVFPLGVCLVSALIVRPIGEVKKSMDLRNGFVLMFFITIGTGIYAVVGSVSTSLSPIKSLIGTLVWLVCPLFIIPIGEKLRACFKREMKIHHNTNTTIHPDASVDSPESTDIESVDYISTFGSIRSDGSIDYDNYRSCNGSIRSNLSIDLSRIEYSNFYNSSEVTKSIELFRTKSIAIENVGKEEEVKEEENIGVREEIGVKTMLRRVDFWLYFMVYFFGATLGLVYLNNLGQIAESRGCSRTSSLVALSSSFGFFGRLLPSLFDYFFSRSKYMLSRPASIATLMAPMAASFLLLINPTDAALYISTAIIGICTGAITSISVATTTELFGSKNFSVNHNVVVANIPIGSFVYGYIAAMVYKEARRNDNSDGKCIGMECYERTFVLWGCLCFFGTFLALVLYVRTRKFYSEKL